MTLEVAYLDRDGTINVDRHYLSSVEGFAFCDGAVAGLAKLRDLGLSLVVVTNQSGVGRGYFSGDRLAEIHAHMTTELARHAIHLDGIYTCPHAPDEGCDCRKPLPGLIHQAEAELGRRRGVMIGDSLRDIQAGKAAGLLTVLISAQAPDLSPEDQPDHITSTLIGAADWIAAQGTPSAKAR